MQPVHFEAEQSILLPPDVEFVVYAKDQPEYQPLPVARLPGADGRVVSRWSLTPEERARIVAGEDLYIEVLTFRQPLQPILPTVGLRDMCPADVKG